MKIQDLSHAIMHNTLLSVFFGLGNYTYLVCFYCNEVQKGEIIISYKICMESDLVFMVSKAI